MPTHATPVHAVSALNEINILTTLASANPFKYATAERITAKNARPDFVIIFCSVTREWHAERSLVFYVSPNDPLKKSSRNDDTAESALIFAGRLATSANFLCARNTPASSRIAHANSQIISRLISWSNFFWPASKPSQEERRRFDKMLIAVAASLAAAA